VVVAHIGHHIGCLGVQLLILFVYHSGRTIDLVYHLPGEFTGRLAQIVDVLDLGDEGDVVGRGRPLALSGCHPG